jgi:mannose-1-phosphate guanylyltransferase
MLQHTLARADLLSPRERQLTVIRRSHLPDARGQFTGRPLKTLILQPENRDTGPGVFLPLTYVRAKDVDATVVFYPSDHFVCPEDEFARVVAGAALAADQMPDRLVLLGVAPEGPESDYGWIAPGEILGWASGHAVHRVRSFREKPARSQAKDLIASRGLWNTLIFAVKQKTLWEMGRRHFPDVMPLFERLGDAIGGPRERPLLKELYDVMPSRNFSSGLLAHSADEAAVIELPTEVLWSDWGRPERIAATIHRINKLPAFPWGCLKPGYQT